VGRRGRAAAVATAGACAALAFAPSAPAGPPARASADVEGLVSYLTTGKLKPGKRITYRFVCSTACQVTASSTLVLKGPNLGPVVDSGMFAAGEVGAAFLKPNGAARDAIKDHIGASKLSTRLVAVDSAGATDTDTRTFRFKR
jgi:hypothetical protein